MRLLPRASMGLFAATLPKLLLAGALREAASCVMPSAASASKSSSSSCEHGTRNEYGVALHLL